MLDWRQNPQYMTTDHFYPSKNLRMNHVVITNDNNDEDDYDNNDKWCTTVSAYTSIPKR